MITEKQLKEADDLSVKASITKAEALNIIIQEERNQILRQAFVVSSEDETAPALVAIAIALGINDKL